MTTITIATFTLPNFTATITEERTRGTKYIVEVKEGYKTLQHAAYDSLQDAIIEYTNQITD